MTYSSKSSLYLSYIYPRYLYGKENPITRYLTQIKEVPSPEVLIETMVNNGASSDEVSTHVFSAVEKAKESLGKVFKLNIQIVDYWSEEYPELLRKISDPPWVLYYLGRLPNPMSTRLAIVGTRRPNRYGYELISNILPKLQIRPLEVISGLAYGIDGASHQMACEMGLSNFAVLGSGVDEIYPEAHEKLAAMILDRCGGILSEYPPGEKPLAKNFPRRNRIISGLSHVVWVVQGSIKSGAQHTSTYALEQAREVVACPGDVFSDLSHLPNKLLFDGCSCILKPADLDQILAKQHFSLASLSDHI